MYLVYILRWPRSNLVYVGRTTNLENRLKAHIRAWKYLNLGKPYAEVLESNLTEEQAYEKEKLWIDFFRSTILDNGLNKTLGGKLGHERYVNPQGTKNKPK